MKFQPLRDEVLIEFVPMAERLTPAGIVLPEVVAPGDGEREMIVRATGPGRTLDDGRVVPMVVQNGDLVYIRATREAYPPFYDPDDGKLYAVVPESCIAAIVTEPQRALSPPKVKIVAPGQVKFDKNGKPVIVHQ